MMHLKANGALKSYNAVSNANDGMKNSVAKSPENAQNALLTALVITHAGE